MAMGGSHHHKGNSYGSSRSSGKPYGLMLLLAFGAALLGVMVLHKLRERRIFTLLLKDKDSHLISLQLLLQKEREYSKEMKRKNQEVKENSYSLRTQKMELDRMVLEMQSTIDSLKDEHKALESALEEKQNEIKMQREQIDASKQKSQPMDLKEVLKQKEAGIEDSRQRLEHPVKVWSASTDDPTNSPVNSTATSNVAENDKSDTSSSKEARGELHESAKFNEAEAVNSTGIDDRNEKNVGGVNVREITVERLEKPEISQDEDFKNGGGIVRKGIEEGEEERKKIGNLTEQTVDHQVTVSEPIDDSSYVKDGIEHTITKENESEKPQDPLEYEKQEVQASSKGGMKLEMHDSRTRLRRKHGHLSRTKGKRWIRLAKKRVSENNGVVTMQSRSRGEGQVSNEGIEKSKGKETGENPQESRKTVNARLVKANPEDAEYRENRDDENADPNQQVQKENESRKKSKSSQDEEVLKDITVIDAASNISTYEEKQFPNEAEQLEEEANSIQQKLISVDNYEQENKPKQVNDGVKHQFTDDAEAADVQESENEATNSEFTQDEDKAEYEETDEPEF